MGNTYKGTSDAILTEAEKTLLRLGNIPEDQIVMNDIDINVHLRFI
jgi:hypothetical protein